MARTITHPALQPLKERFPSIKFMVGEFRDMITVVVNGEVIASDTPDVIRSHPEVIVAYLGEDHA